ncbi:bifunctional hydroxymethylpyrimidine kinase/phosphomethylpyrimidine kinase [Isoptericola dokdonensis]|uniref:Hydroxymethylpyrimidine/phosphomethylpyrimidine kinase n=1 Tax=Isoptericola dokdonensis DS-3 TaxID=1300344 RepID=A0A168EN76_9MICO|nr:Hydroxymethylpyrimidine/phosphomethylpyrimidine kinase [Isoptericola dokdonensis DS-3]
MTLLPRPRPAVPRVLAVAGSDPSGGAGIQADLKSVAAAGGYGMAALTALTAQSTHGVTGVHVPPPEFLALQLSTLTADVTVDAVKIGMLATADVADVVADWLGALGDTRPPVVLDPVMVATSGDRLLDRRAEDAVRALLTQADVVTPNLPELATLLGAPVAADWATALDQATALAARHRVLVVAKGGHLDGPLAPDALVGPGGVLVELTAPRVVTTAGHGTGCSLSSGLATRYAAGGDWAAALAATKEWLTAALRAGPGLDVGSGRGPVDHLVHLRPVPVPPTGVSSEVSTAPGR